MNPSVDEILHALHEAYPAQVTETMLASDTLRQVVQAYIDDPETDARQAAHRLTFFLRSFRYLAPLIYKELRTPYRIDPDSAVEEIHNAARHISSNNPNFAEVVSGNREQLELLRQQDPGIMDLSRPENLKKLAERDLLSHALESIADALASLSEDQITPDTGSMHFIDSLHIETYNLKEKGGAGDRDGALRGFIVRELDTRVPADIDNRYSIIRHLAALAGVEMEKSYPRSLLLRGKT